MHSVHLEKLPENSNEKVLTPDLVFEKKYDFFIIESLAEEVIKQLRDKFSKLKYKVIILEKPKVIIDGRRKIELEFLGTEKEYNQFKEMLKRDAQTINDWLKKNRI